MSAELARKFHDAYERLAPSFGYETRADTKAFDPESPNGRLMIAVCSELFCRPPASSERVALSDERIVKIALDHGFRGMPSAFVRLARVIEADHGILPTGAPNERWAVFCDKCGKTWSVPYRHNGRDRCNACLTVAPRPDAPTSQIEPAPGILPVKESDHG